MMAAASTAAAQTASANGILRTLSLAIIRPVPPGNGSRSFKEQAGYRRPAKTSPRLRRKLPQSCARTTPPYGELTCIVASELSETQIRDRVFAWTAGGDTIQTSYGTNCVGVLGADAVLVIDPLISPAFARQVRSEEHTSELQSRSDLVCRLLLEKKKKIRQRGTLSHLMAAC